MAFSLCKWLLLGLFLVKPGEVKLMGEFTHPFYMSVTEINHNAKDQILEISCKIFTNDFEASLSRLSKSKIDLSDAKSKAVSDKLIATYISGHLMLKVDGRPVNLQFIGSEKETDATWCYFQVDKVPALKRLDVTNSLLYETFESQINIIHATANGIRKSTKLVNPETTTFFEF
jgi:hypothetical protein